MCKQKEEDLRKNGKNNLKGRRDERRKRRTTDRTKREKKQVKSEMEEIEENLDKTKRKNNDTAQHCVFHLTPFFPLKPS